MNALGAPIHQVGTNGAHLVAFSSLINRAPSVRSARWMHTLDAYAQQRGGGAQSAVHRSFAYLALCRGKSQFVVQSAGHSSFGCLCGATQLAAQLLLRLSFDGVR